MLPFPGDGLDTHILYSDLPVRLEVSNDIFLQHYFTRETEFSSLSLVSMSKLLVSFRQFEKKFASKCQRSLLLRDPWKHAGQWNILFLRPR